MTRTSSGRVLTIWRTITQIRLTDEQKSDFVTHDALDELMSHQALRLAESR